MSESGELSVPALIGRVIESQVHAGVRYQLEGLVGAGGMGSAYLARRDGPEGSSAVVALHGSLNSGQLAPIARPDVPFTPHVTVAALEDPEQAAAVADELNASGVAIAGTIFAIDVLELDGKAVREILRIDLRG